ncbi:MAG: monovalent cation/H(+) antiporter subunit G [Alphaproteobacteria bacterium]|nr:monovalent cation/H(+) antiporter subunit G [Alphaproteobacteria bacterium]MBE8220034.1 monovalent cation/H(+) antiporter subunit G [Alphaproteobacteria bacterium]
MGSSTWDIIRFCIGIACLGIGCLLTLLGAIGMLRLRDVYQRMHGAGIVDTGGAGLVLFGLLLLSPDWQTSVRLIMIGAVLVFTAPTATHAIARAARFAGIRPELAHEEKETSS